MKLSHVSLLVILWGAAFSLVACKPSAALQSEGGSAVKNGVGFSVPIPADVAEKIGSNVEVKLTMWASADGQKPATDNVRETNGGWNCDKVVSDIGSVPVVGSSSGGDGSIAPTFDSFRCGSNGGRGDAAPSTLGRGLNEGVTYSGFELIIYTSDRTELYKGSRQQSFKVESGLTNLSITVQCTDAAKAKDLCTAGKKLEAVGFAGEESAVSGKIQVQVKIQETPTVSDADKQALVTQCLDNIKSAETQARQHCQSSASTAICDDLLRKATLASVRASIDVDATFTQCESAGFFKEAQ